MSTNSKSPFPDNEDVDAESSLSQSAVTPKPWAESALEKFLNSVLKEQRTTRRWGILFKVLTFTYLGVVLWVLGGAGVRHAGGLVSDDSAAHTAVVDFQGTIEANGPASAEHIVDALNNAFAQNNTKGVILRINSPGGSPVQSGIIYDEIRRLRAKHPQIKVYAVVEDICASGGYYVASAADAIYVNQASIIGSIGVLMDGFGFTETMQKLGVERRLLTAGENKGFMDPFSPLDKKKREYAQALLNDIHQQFITAVKTGRGTRLKNDPLLFSGLVWTGAQGIELGLADGYGTVDSVARTIIKAPELVHFAEKENIAERLAKKFGVIMADRLVHSTQSVVPNFH